MTGHVTLFGCTIRTRSNCKQGREKHEKVRRAKKPTVRAFESFFLQRV